jgi:hypothetical protein
LQLAVHVLTGAAGSQAGAASGIYDGTASTTSETHALTNTQPGSWLYVAVGNGDQLATLTPVGSEVNVDVWNDTHSGNDAAIGWLATSGTGSQVLGWTASNSDTFEWAAQEVLHC